MSIRDYRLFTLLGTIMYLLSCAPSGGHSDDCGPNPPATNGRVVSVNNNPPPNFEIIVNKPSNDPIELKIIIQIDRTMNFCGNRYTGKLTLYLKDPPAGISASFDPVDIPATSNEIFQTVTMNLLITPSVQIGKYSISIKSNDNEIFVFTPYVTIVN